ncbi:MAG: hypothetical protein GEU74_15035 [Nitriliruptorales bacterium]|nr:hypothetical protein [Nitriliruptorales bacterium]
MKPGEGLRGRVQDATLALLPEGLRVEVIPRSVAGVPSFDVRVQAGRATHRFVAGWAGPGWPADVRTLVKVASDLDVVYAKKLSDGARSLLSERHIGWVDETGRANVLLESGLVIVREPRATESNQVVRDHWTRTMLAAVEAVLAGVAPTVEAIEGATGMSRGASANALSRLERHGLLERPARKRGPNAARQVADVDSLIDQYTEAAAEFRNKQKVVRVHRLWADPLDVLDIGIGPGLTATGVTWAVTGAAASTLLAPYLSDVTIVELYVDRSLLNTPDRLASILGGRVVERGHRIEVRELPTAMSARGPRIGGVQVALPARVYADLMGSGGRAAEAAHHLREVRGVGPGS